MVQTIIAANNNRQSNSWKQLLIVVAIVVVYGVKILVGAKKSVTKDEEQPDESPQPPLQQQGGQRPERERVLFNNKSIPMVPLEKIKTAAEPEFAGIKLSALQEPGQQEQGRIALDLDLNLDDTDNLRKAIIYSEILGKPLALRQDG